MDVLWDGSVKCLLTQTKFSGFSFWNYQDICKITGAKYPAAPLGLLTVAALLPQHWQFRLVDENVEPVTDEHLQWAQIVCIGGMLPQQKNMLALIDRAKKAGCIVVAGGADPTSQPEVYSSADFLVLGEGEVTIPMFLDDLKNGAKKGIYRSEKKADMSVAVVPRYDLIKFGDYIMMGIQSVRGCPFNCEFCDIIELFGRVPRFKTTQQILKELQSLYDLGYRGHIDFVDDNFIGNKNKAQELLRAMKEWLKERKYPFYFTTEASLNLADDDELLQLMKDVDFRYVFLGIETPEDETLILNKKKHNLGRNVTDAIKKLMSYGIVSNGGFIMGFDSDSQHIADNMIDCIQKSGICMAMLGLLYALPNTQLTRRLKTEGRLYTERSSHVNDSDIDQSTSGLNFETRRPKKDILADFAKVIAYIYTPENYYKRVIYNGLYLRVDYKYKPTFKRWMQYLRSFIKLCYIVGFDRHTGWLYWKMIFIIIFRNPHSLEAVINLAAMYIHFQKQKNYIIGEIQKVLCQ